MATQMSPDELLVISIIERFCSVLSIIGSLFIILTFCLSDAFHRPVNRLVFYASFGNLLSNVGTLISRSYVGSPDSAGCQTQAFLIQMFMPADACWTLAMAINVYLTFYHKFDAERLRRIEPIYLACCYGIPFIPAFTYIFIRDGDLRPYGDARLWCWIVPEWDIWRIATFYAPVWVIIVATFFIYIRAGRTIYSKRKQLFYASGSDPGPLSYFGETTFSRKTTEVVITSEEVGNGSSSIEMRTISLHGPGASSPGDALPKAYSVTIFADPDGSHCGPPREDTQPKSNPLSAAEAAVPRMTARRRNQEINNAAWAYTKCSILFFSAILITWIPSSSNRVYSVVHGGQYLLPVEYMSAFVLPLQGFWNAVIYMVTSWAACRNLWADIWSRRSDSGDGVGGARLQGSTPRSNVRRLSHGTRGAKAFESESQTELASEGRYSSRNPSEAPSDGHGSGERL